MNDIAEQFLRDCKGCGRPLVRILDVPHEIFEELARRKDSALVQRMITIVEDWRSRIETIRQSIQLHKKMDEVMGDIDDALDFIGEWGMLCGDTLKEVRGINHTPLMKELAEVCLNNEQMRYYQAILYLEGASTLEEDDLWDIRPIVDGALEALVDNLDNLDAVFDAEQFKVAFF